MIISAVDTHNNLFKVQYVVPELVVKEMLATDWLAQPWRKQEWQEDWLRRKIDNTDTVQKIDKFLQSKLSCINAACRTSFTNCHTILWLDEPGFTVGIHEDNPGVVGSMQLYWATTNSAIGTAFFSDTNGQRLRYRCPYVVNTGYIMVNGPGQWHGMLTPVPSNTFRLSSYTYFD